MKPWRMPTSAAVALAIIIGTRNGPTLLGPFSAYVDDLVLEGADAADAGAGHDAAAQRARRRGGARRAAVGLRPVASAARGDAEQRDAVGAAHLLGPDVGLGVEAA